MAKQLPMSDFLSTAVLFLLVAGSLRVWTGVIRRWSRGRSAVDFEPTGVPPWGLIDILLAIALLFTFTSMATYILNERFDVAPGAPVEEQSLEYQRWHNATAVCLSLPVP